MLSLELGMACLNAFALLLNVRCLGLHGRKLTLGCSRTVRQICLSFGEAALHGTAAFAFSLPVTQVIFGNWAHGRSL